MLERAELRDEERGMLERPRQAFESSVVETLRAVRKRMPLDYFGVDFGIAADGAVVLFEANATMDSISPILDPEFAYGRHVAAAGAPRTSRDDPGIADFGRGRRARADRRGLERSSAPVARRTAAAGAGGGRGGGAGPDRRPRNAATQ